MDARELHGLAATQKWLLRREQVLERRSADQLEYAVRTRQLLPVFRVYKPWGAPDWWEQRLQAACWSFAAVASHRSASRVHRYEGVPAVRLEVTVPYPRQVRATGLVVHSSKLLLPEFVTEVDGIPVTTPDRTCIDLSAVCSSDVVEKAWESAKVAGLITAESVQRTAIKMQARGRRRMQIVWEILARWDPSIDLKDVDLQTRTWRWMELEGLELPEIEFWVVVNGMRFRLDFAWPALKVCVECDGWEHHGVRRRFRTDRDKITELELAGWLVVPVTSDMSRQTVIDRIRRALALRGPTFLQ
jgi:very-short-patch-repair endonuclease